MKIDISKYSTKKELFDYLVLNKGELFEFKKAELKFADCVGGTEFENKISKTLNTNNVDDVESGAIKRTIIGNTYNWMDSHDDVHLDGLFAVSIKERGTKILHLHDHEYKLTSKVGKPEKIYEKSVAWTDLGINKTGNTMALFMDSEIKKSMNENIFLSYLNGEIDQHSVGMQYVKLELAINDKDYKEEYAVWKAYVDRIGNKQRATDKGFFWAIKEAKLKEISAVLEGSNELTGTVQNIQSTKVADNTESDKSAQPKKGIDWNFIANNFKLNN